MMPKWREDFEVEIQTDAMAEGMSREEAGMACGLACLRMIERWATKGARPNTYRTWLDRTRQDKSVYRKEGVLWDNLRSTIKQSFRDVCEVKNLKPQEFETIPERLHEGGEKDIVLAKIGGFYWPHNRRSLLLDDVKHYVVITQAEETRVRPDGEPKWFVSIGDPVRAYLTFERWERQGMLIEKAAVISRKW